MNSLTIKQKIILGAIIGAMLIVIGIYGYISLNNEEELDISELVDDEIIVNSHVQENIEVADQNETEVEENNFNSSENTNQNSRTRNYY